MSGQKPTPGLSRTPSGISRLSKGLIPGIFSTALSYFLDGLCHFTLYLRMIPKYWFRLILSIGSTGSYLCPCWHICVDHQNTFFLMSISPFIILPPCRTKPHWHPAAIFRSRDQSEAKQPPLLPWQPYCCDSLKHDGSDFGDTTSPGRGWR